MTILAGQLGPLGKANRLPAVPFTPAAISTALWLDASDSATITNVAGRATVWNDKSGNSRHASKISTNGPLISTLNGLPSLTFAASTGMRLPSFTTFPAKRGCLIGIFQFTPAAAHEVYGALLGPYPTPGTGWEWMVSNSNTPASRYKFYAGSGATLRSALADGNGLQIGSLVRSADTTLLHHRNGTLADTLTIPDFAALTATCGVGANNLNSENMIGPLPEIIVLDTAPSDTIRQKLEGYLAHKWGTTASLPSDHPYKTEAPTV
jgi:hypothetical protein